MFNRVPYEYIIHHRVAQCSSCGARFILEKEELEAALKDAIREGDAQAKAKAPYTETIESEEPLTLEPGETLGIVEPEAEETFKINGFEELETEQSLEIEESAELEAEQSLEIEETEELEAEQSLEIEAPEELEAEQALKIEEPEELKAEQSLEIEEPLELEAEETLEIEEPEELEAEQSLEIEEPLELEAEQSLEIEEPLEPEAEETLEIEEQQELKAEQSLEIKKPEELEAEQSLEIEAQHAEGSMADSSMPPGAGVEPEKENKIEFARRLSRLIPEGWANLPHSSDSSHPSGRAPQELSAEATNPHTNSRQLLIFTLGTAEFAAPIENTAEIGILPELTRLPHVPEWLLGIINLRGDMVAVVDIKDVLGMGPLDPGHQNRIILLRSLESDVCAAVIVNRIGGMHYIAEDAIVKSDAEHRSSEPYISGVYETDGRSIAILDIENLLQSDDMQQFRSI